MIEPPSPTKAESSYRPRRARLLRTGSILIALDLFLIHPAVQASLPGAAGGGPMAALYALTLILFLILALASFANALLGLPRLAIAPTGVTLETISGTSWAAWESLAPFSLANSAGPFRRSLRSASAGIIGAAASPSLQRGKKFTIPDAFLTPIDTLVAELNAHRASVTGSSTASGWATEPKKELPLGAIVVKTPPWVTFLILAVLVAVFVAEQRYAVVLGGPGGRANIATLVALGALNHRAVLADGEWYRLLTGPLLHLDVIHLLMNGIGLVFAGYLLERLVGRIWYVALFIIGALGGSLMSLAINPATLTSVGASGAIMGLFAAALVISFRLPAGSRDSWRIQMGALRVLIPSLLPLATSGAQVDYAAHLGGTLGGTAAAFIFLKNWRDPERLVAIGIVAIGVLISLIGGTELARHYGKYRAIAELIPAKEVPKSNPSAAEAERLVTRYPRDPRAHVFRGLARAAAHDNAGAESELRIALAQIQELRFFFGIPAEMAIRATLAAIVSDSGRQSEAKEIAEPVCRAAPEQAMDKVKKTLADSHLCE